MRLALGPLQAPERLVLGAVEAGALGRLQPEHVDEEAPGALQVRDRERHRARHGADPGARALAALGGPRGSSSISSTSTPSGSRRQARLAPGSPSGSPSGGVPARHRALERPLEVGDPERDRRVADVARLPVPWQQTHQGAPELEQLDLEKVLAIDQPPAGRGRARHPLHHRGERAGEQVGAAGGLQPEHLPVPALRPAKVGDAQRDLGEAHDASLPRRRQRVPDGTS